MQQNGGAVVYVSPFFPHKMLATNKVLKNNYWAGFSDTMYMCTKIPGIDYSIKLTCAESRDVVNWYQESEKRVCIHTSEAIL